MPATPVTLNFPTLVDTVVAFATVGAWNTYFGNVSFTLTGANLPEAQLGSLGAVLMSANAAATSSTWTTPSWAGGVNITSVDSGGVQSTVAVATQADMLQVMNSIAELKDLYDSLIVALQNAGIMSNA